MENARAWKWVVKAILLAAAGIAVGAHLDQHQVVGDMEIFYGMISAAEVRALPAAERAMHGGVPAGKGQHHLMVTLFDRTSKQRIADAEVWASVGEIGLATTRKRLEPMASGPMSYGNYFRMDTPGRYRVRLEIRRPGAFLPVKTEFDYVHASR
ncbi:MAG: hypothetical protein HYU76_00390 [Betaproteobacteria bacterium]|nr:hypothetical protein [Betaproteobacteria bacterium]